MYNLCFSIYCDEMIHNFHIVFMCIDVTTKTEVARARPPSTLTIYAMAHVNGRHRRTVIERHKNTGGVRNSTACQINANRMFSDNFPCRYFFFHFFSLVVVCNFGCVVCVRYRWHAAFVARTILRIYVRCCHSIIGRICGSPTRARSLLKTECFRFACFGGTRVYFSGVRV